MENEENRSLIDKKAYEDQLANFFSGLIRVDFYQISFIALILFSLSPSYSWTFKVFLEHSWRVWHTCMVRERRQRKSRKAQEDIENGSYNKFCLQVSSCMYVFLTSFCMHGICMWCRGYDMSLAWRISQIDSVFAQPFHFLDSHGVVDFTFFFLVVFLVPLVVG